MRTIQKIISAGFATCALASASVPALAWSVWPDVDFQWYADVGKPMTGATVELYPAPREGWIWSPGHYENRGSRQVWVEGRWIRDDYAQQVSMYNSPTQYVDSAATPLAPPPPVVGEMPVIRDSAGNPIPMNPSAYPVDSIDSSRR